MNFSLLSLVVYFATCLSHSTVFHLVLHIWVVCNEEMAFYIFDTTMVSVGPDHQRLLLCFLAFKLLLFVDQSEHFLSVKVEAKIAVDFVNFLLDGRLSMHSTRNIKILIIPCYCTIMFSKFESSLADTRIISL